MHTARDVHMPVFLALHSIVPKVGQKPEPVRTSLGTNLSSHSGYFGYHHAAPQLLVRHVLFGYGQQHYWGPPEPVLKDYDRLVFIQDFGWLSPGDNFTENTRLRGQYRLLLALGGCLAVSFWGRWLAPLSL